MKLFLLLLMLLFVPAAHAATRCECGAPKSLDEYKTRAFGVFMGEVTRIRRLGDSERVRVFFDVHAVWKGAQSETISVITVDEGLLKLIGQSRACGYSFQQGERYLVFSYRRKNDRGPGWTSVCWPTSVARGAEGESYMRQLGAPKVIYQQAEQLNKLLDEVPAEAPAPTTPTVNSGSVLETTPLPSGEIQPYLLPGADGNPHVQFPHIDR